MGNYDVLMVGWFVVLPFDRQLDSMVDCPVSCTENVRKWKTAKIEVTRENLSVTQTDVYKGVRCWIRD